jgi:hypothetical protein
MNKSVVFLAFALIVFSCNSQAPQKSDLASNNLKGRVWKVSRKINETGESCGCTIKTDCSQSEYVYNEKGNLIVYYTIDENKVTNDSSSYSYTKNGLCTEILKYRINKPVGKEVPVVKGGKVTGIKIYNEKGEAEANVSYIYTGDEITEEQTVDINGKSIGTILKEYSNGQLVVQTEKDSDGNVKSISKYKRNSANDIIECLTTITKDNKDFKLIYEYEYDSAGNWVKQTQTYDGAIINIIIRNIEYFKS